MSRPRLQRGSAPLVYGPLARETPPPRQPLPPPLGPRRSEHPSRTGQPEDSGSDIDRHPLGARVQGQGGGLSSIPDPSGVSALPRRRRVWWRRGWGWEELEGGSGRRRLDGVYGLRRGRWTGPRTGTQRAHPRPGQPLAALLAASRATPTPVPAPPPGGGAPLTLQQPPPICRARPAARRSTPPSLSPIPGRGRTRGRGAAQGAAPGGSCPARPPASRLPGSDTAAQEAARRPCRAGALLSLVWNSHRTRKPQAGQRPWGAGAAPGGGVDAGCGLRETRALRI